MDKEQNVIAIGIGSIPVLEKWTVNAETKMAENYFTHFC